MPNRMGALGSSCLLALVLASCGSKVEGSGDDVIDASPGSIDADVGPFHDFPADPIIDTEGGATTPANAGDLFGAADDGGAGPCLVEPEAGTMFPKNWLRPRFSWNQGAQNLFEIKLTAANQVNPLVVYTTNPSWTMPATMWASLSAHTVDADITMTIRGAVLNGNVLTAGPSLGTSGTVSIAPVEAPGSIVYWTTSGGTALRGFNVGEETVHPVLTPAQSGSGMQCIGCHASTPDGAFIGLSATSNPNNGDPTQLTLRAGDGSAAEPGFLTPSARTLMARLFQEEPVFSAMHWSNGDHVAVNLFPPNGGAHDYKIMWTDLEAASTAEGIGFGFFNRTGDNNFAASVTFAHTSDNLLYVSSPDSQSGVLVHQGDLRVIPYGNRSGGSSNPIAGAATAEFNEYYPTYSPDDALIAYDRVPNGDTSYNNVEAEVFVIPSGGGTPTRLVANDPPACSGVTSPGVLNSWPKWSPGTSTVGTRTYYWLTFSSTRLGGNPQLFVTPVVVDNGTISSFPALYLWNQPPDENNHTPVWDYVDIGIE